MTKEKTQAEILAIIDDAILMRQRRADVLIKDASRAVFLHAKSAIHTLTEVGEIHYSINDLHVIKHRILNDE